MCLMKLLAKKKKYIHCTYRRYGCVGVRMILASGSNTKRKATAAGGSSSASSSSAAASSSSPAGKLKGKGGGGTSHAPSTVAKATSFRAVHRCRVIYIYIFFHVILSRSFARQSNFLDKECNII